MKYITADILRRAANEHLWDGESHGRDDFPYSCLAIGRACLPGYRADLAFDEISDFLQEMGVNLLLAFDDIPAGPSRQAARFLWLHMLACAVESGDI